MKNRFLFLLSLAFAAVAAAQNVNVQKAASTNAITGNLSFGSGKLLNIANGSTFQIGTTTPALISGDLGALTITGAGTNQNINFTPSGTGQVLIGVGSASLPGLSFTGQTGAGIFTSSGTLGLSTGGTTRLSFSANGSSATFSTQVQFQSGAVGSPSIAWSGGGSNGIWFPGSNSIAFSTGGILGLTIDGSQNTTFAGRAIGASFGTATAAAVLLRYNGSAAITINDATATGLQFNGYGAGALSTDGSGNVTATSDARKKDIAGDFTRGLDAVRQLKPKTYHWRKDSGLSPTELNAGFIAQDVLPVIPEAIGQDSQGFYTFADRPVTAALVNAVNELDRRPPADWWARGIAAAALVLAIRANLRGRAKVSSQDPSQN